MSGLWQEEQFGVLCDRRRWGLGQVLLATGRTVPAAEARTPEVCGMSGEHAHLIVKRLVSYTAWSEPIAGETAACTPVRPVRDAGDEEGTG